MHQCQTVIHSAKLLMATSGELLLLFLNLLVEATQFLSLASCSIPQTIWSDHVLQIISCFCLFSIHIRWSLEVSYCCLEFLFLFFNCVDLFVDAAPLWFPDIITLVLFYCFQICSILLPGSWYSSPQLFCNRDVKDVPCLVHSVAYSMLWNVWQVHQVFYSNLTVHTKPSLHSGLSVAEHEQKLDNFPQFACDELNFISSDKNLPNLYTFFSNIHRLCIASSRNLVYSPSTVSLWCSDILPAVMRASNSLLKPARQSFGLVHISHGPREDKLLTIGNLSGLLSSTFFVTLIKKCLHFMRNWNTSFWLAFVFLTVC